MNFDRFAAGLPDQQEKPNEPIDECALDSCQEPIYFGQQVWIDGCDSYCSLHCLIKDRGIKKVTAEK